MKKQILVLILLFCIACESATLTPTTVVTDQPTQTATDVVATETWIPFPTETSTAYPSPTATSTPTATETPTIIEVTPFPATGSPADYWQGLPTGTYFIPSSNLNVRSCPGTVCDIIGKVYAGTSVQVYLIYFYWGSEEKWLCRVPVEDLGKGTLCPEAFIYEWNGRMWGDLWLP